jgi:hypothetical protein
MNILEALKEPIFFLPKYHNYDFFPIYLEECFSDFLATVDKIDQGSFIDSVKKHRYNLSLFCDKLVSSSKKYYNGLPAKAYLDFEEGMKIIDEFLFPIPEPGEVKHEWEPFYRARKPDSTRITDRKDMFHVPFESRENVTTQRFSVPGFPCLYLSNSPYVCWEELRKPPIDKMMVSRFKLENIRMKFLDLSLTPRALIRTLEHTTSTQILFSKKGEKIELPPVGSLDSWDKGTLNYVMRWPLIASCSLKVKRKEVILNQSIFFLNFCFNG